MQIFNVDQAVRIAQEMSYDQMYTNLGFALNAYNSIPSPINKNAIDSMCKLILMKSVCESIGPAATKVRFENLALARSVIEIQKKGSN